MYGRRDLLRVRIQLKSGKGARSVDNQGWVEISGKFLEKELGALKRKDCLVIVCVCWGYSVGNQTDVNPSPRIFLGFAFRTFPLDSNFSRKIR